jgi:uncharacterized protein (TIGR00297 family)
MDQILWYLLTTLTALTISFQAYTSKKLTKNASITAFFMGTTTLSLQPVIGIQILTLFFLGKIVTKIGKTKKSKIEENFSQQRDSYQVLANGGISWFLTVLFYFGWIDANFAKSMSLFAISAATGDTFSSELGILSEQTPRMITSFKKVPRGTNGGVTSFGVLAAGLGGCLVGLVTCFVQFEISFVTICLGVLSGITGSTIDSILGAVLEFSGLNTKTGKVVDKTGQNVEVIQNRSILSGNSVNFISSLATALIFAIFV